MQKKRTFYPPMVIASTNWIFFVVAIGLPILTTIADYFEGFYMVWYTLLSYQIWAGLSVVGIIYVCFDIVRKKKLTWIMVIATIMNVLFVFIVTTMLRLLGSL